MAVSFADVVSVASCPVHPDAITARARWRDAAIRATHAALRMTIT
jgi:hypothetical protein